MLLLTKAVFAIMIGFLSSVVLGLFLVPILRKMRVGQKISIFVTKCKTCTCVFMFCGTVKEQFKQIKA